jgi:uncharacterized RDD family membrane protein YckC
LKQEVNRRLAAHKSRRCSGPVEQKAQPVRITANSLAAQAAARVAARYAQAPSYSDLQAAEARTALRTAQIATQVAMEAQASVEAALDGLEAARQQEKAAPQTHARADQRPPVASPVVEAIETVDPLENLDRERLQIRWEPELPVRSTEPITAQAAYPEKERATAAEEAWSELAASAEPRNVESRNADSWAAETWSLDPLEPVEPMQPLHANLIEFPRELVATRKGRPRLADADAAAAETAERQLSIFEVDPSTIASPSAPAAPAWQEADHVAPRWSGMELDPQSSLELPDDPVAPQPVMELASFSRRLMAVVVDSALVTAFFLGAAWAYFRNLDTMPELRVLEVNAVAALLAIGLLYHVLFFTLGEATPGMCYARLSLCTFEDQRPSRAQLHFRLGALLLSLIPAGLGIVWALFDEDHLSWHDRLSRTYLRKC